MYGGALGSPPAAWTTSLGEMVNKIDGKLKVCPLLATFDSVMTDNILYQKITTTLLKELDAFARNGIKDELASLDPLLRNMDDGFGTSSGKALYDFEGV